MSLPEAYHLSVEQEVKAYQEQITQSNQLLEELQLKLVELSHQNAILENELIDLHESNQTPLYKDYFNLLPTSIIVINGHGIILDLNQTAADFLDTDKNSVMGRSLRTLLSNTSFSDFTQQFNQYKANSDSKTIFYSLKLKDQRQFTLRLNKVLQVEAGQCNTLVGIITGFDSESNHFSKYLANIAIEQMREGIIITDNNGSILRVNNAFSEISGFSKEEAIGQNPRILKSGRHNLDFYENIWRHIQHHGWWAGEIWNRRKNGNIFPEWLQINRLVDPFNQKTYYVSIFSDITERKHYQDKLDRLAHYDNLTGLMNRHFMKITLQGLLERLSEDRPSQLAIMFIDLDHFKQINDRFGHREGDLVLQETAQRLLAAVRNTDMVSRLSGDEFVIIFPRLNQTEVIQSISDKILKQLSHPFLINKNQHHISASIGVSFFPEDGNNIEDLMKRADSAMYRSKNSGRNQLSFFDHQYEQNLISHAQVKGLLRKAIQEPQEYIQMHYQPVVDCEFGHAYSLEALVRLKNDDGQLIPPNNFIEIAEREGLIEDLGAAIFGEVCQFMSDNREQGLKQLPIAVNLSAVQLANPRVYEHFDAIAGRFNLQLSQFGFELTETSAMQNMDTILSVLYRFRQAGCKLLLDDFGTGYASLSQLHKLPIDVVKIDKSFTQLVDGENASNQKLVTAILSMANALELEVITEGVETEHQAQWLKEHRVEKVQGYLFSKPLNVKNIRQRYLT